MARERPQCSSMQGSEGAIVIQTSIRTVSDSNFGKPYCRQDWVHMGTSVVFFLVPLSVRHFPGKEKLFLGSRPLHQKVVNLVLKL